MATSWGSLRAPGMNGGVELAAKRGCKGGGDRLGRGRLKQMRDCFGNIRRRSQRGRILNQWRWELVIGEQETRGRSRIKDMGSGATPAMAQAPKSVRLGGELQLIAAAGRGVSTGQRQHRWDLPAARTKGDRSKLADGLGENHRGVGKGSRRQRRSAPGCWLRLAAREPRPGRLGDAGKQRKVQDAWGTPARWSDERDDRRKRMGLGAAPEVKAALWPCGGADRRP